MTDETPTATGDATGREAEVLAARRASLERLGARAFAITLADVLGVDVPERTSSVRAAHPDLEADTLTEDVVTIAGRVVLKRDMGKLVFATLRDRDGDLQLVLNAADVPAEDLALFQEVDLGDIIGATGRVGTTRKGELSVFVQRWAMLTKALRPLAREVGGPAGSRSAATSPVSASDQRRSPPPGVPGARGGAQDDAPGARRTWVRRVRGADAADDRGRRERPAVHDASPRARHPVEAADQPGAVSEADARRRCRAGLRARPQLPQRGHRPRSQPRVHDARGLPGLRRLPHDDGALGDARAGMRPRGQPDRRPRSRRPRDPGAGAT